MFVQCDEAYLDLFPRFIADISQLKDMESQFPDSSTSFDLSVFDSYGKTCICIVQIIPDKENKLVVLTGDFDVLFTGSSAGFGRVLMNESDSTVLRFVCGRDYVMYDMVARSLTITPRVYPDTGDFVIARTGNSGEYVMYRTVWDLGYNQTSFERYNYSTLAGPPATATNTFYFGQPGVYYAAELGFYFTDYSYDPDFDIPAVLLRNTRTNEGIIMVEPYELSTQYFLPPIIPGGAQKTNYGGGDMVLEHTDGYIRSHGLYYDFMYSMLNIYQQHDQIPASQFSGYKLGYSMNSMYVFNTSGKQIYRTTPWWQHKDDG